MKLIDIIAGARPNFMKIAAILRAIKLRQSQGLAIGYRLIHTGQHYDTKLSDAFFDQLAIPEPDINFQVGSGTHAEQTAAIMLGYEKLVSEKPCDLCLVVGDVTSTMACAITAQKLCIPVAHVESGIRSGDWTMPEEINRIVTDSITNWFFTTSDMANENLIKSGVDEERIFFVGNTMIDTLINNLSRLRKPPILSEFGLKEGEYFVLTLHRPSNVDNQKQFLALLNSISETTRGMPVIFPVHPRTSKTLGTLDRLPMNFHLIEPQPYLEFNYLVKNSKAVITDSGGISEETTFMGVPCLTMRDSTERPETVTIGTNELIGSDLASLAPNIDKIFSGQWKLGSIPPKWDGRAAERIVEALENKIFA